MTFAILLTSMTVVSYVATGRGAVHSGDMWLGGQDGTHTWSQLQLDADKRYTLRFQPISSVALDTESVVSATLLQDDDVIFEVEDAYWHQRGTWHEGGESGTWEEQNAKTDFTFLVPEDGVYDLEFDFVEGRGVSGERLTASLTWRKPRALTWWPLGIGALLMFGVAAWTHSTRSRAVANFLKNMGEGTRLELEGVVYTVIARAEHWEDMKCSAVEFRLRSDQGAERWLAITTYWREHPYLEDSDQYLTQTLIDVPLTPVQAQQLAAQDWTSHSIVAADQFYSVDKENGGFGQLVTRRDGAVYRTRYTAYVFRDMGRFPLSPGDIWVECIVWGPHDEEWSVMKLADIDTLKLVQIVLAEPITSAEASAAPQNDPFGVAHLRKEHGPVQRTQQPFGQQQAQQPFGQQQQQPQQQGQPHNPHAGWHNPDWDS